MKRENKSVFRALATFIGTIIGVGIFGVPFAISQAGFFIGLVYLVILGAALFIINYFYCDVVVNTKERHRLVGYCKIYLGPWARRISYFSLTLGMVGSIIAYIILGGEFLHALVAQFFGGTVFQYQIILFTFIALVALVGLRLVSRIEVVMTIFLLAVMSFIFVQGVPKIEWANLFSFAEPRDIFLPYGVILFALAGTIAIPEIRDVLKGYARDMRRVVRWGTLIPLFLTAIFSLVVVGVTGTATSPESIIGLARALGPWILYIGALFGFLAITTSFLVFAVHLKESFIYDFKVDKYLAWFIAVFTPLAIFLIGSRDFINVISFTGAIFGGFNYILITLLYLKIRAKKKTKFPVIRWPRIIPYALMVIFSLGIVYEVVYTFIR
ncbi:amino acid permease [Patescibacteria group bacterium]|nr:amino acid permease [Patescibacteria group bacterium]MBU1922571.1 amino acid permease [Patescibacteria group bacterium]